MLFYNADKSIIGEWPLNDSWRKRFDLFGMRFFAEVCWYESHGGEQPPDFLKKLPEQGW